MARLTVQSVLRTAANRLKGGRNWSKGTFVVKKPIDGKMESTYCVLGSLGINSWGPISSSQRKDAALLVLEVVREQYPHAGHLTYATDLVYWNDTDPISGEEVAAVIEKAYVRSLEPRFDETGEE